MFRLLVRVGGLLLVLGACSLLHDAQTWNLAIVDLSDPAHPGLCVSRRPDCKGEGVPLALFIVEKFDTTAPVEGANVPRNEWFIEATTNSSLREFKYGQPPPGWREVRPASPLSLGEWYTDGRFFFRVTSETDGVVGVVCDRSEFLERVRSGQMPSCRAAER